MTGDKPGTSRSDVTPGAKRLPGPDPGFSFIPGTCRKCTGVNTHYLTCVTLNLPPGWRLSLAIEEDEWLARWRDHYQERT